MGGRIQTGRSVTKPFAERGQAERQPDRFDDLVEMNARALWLDALRAITAIPLCEPGSVERWSVEAVSGCQ